MPVHRLIKARVITLYHLDMVKRPKIKLSSARPNRDKTIHTANANTEKKHPPARPRSEIAAVIFKLLPKKAIFWATQIPLSVLCLSSASKRIPSAHEGHRGEQGPVGWGSALPKKGWILCRRSSNNRAFCASLT